MVYSSSIKSLPYATDTMMCSSRYVSIRSFTGNTIRRRVSRYTRNTRQEIFFTEIAMFTLMLDRILFLAEKNKGTCDHPNCNSDHSIQLTEPDVDPKATPPYVRFCGGYFQKNKLLQCPQGSNFNVVGTWQPKSRVIPVL